MLNPFGSGNTGSYRDLLQRITRRVKEADIEQQLVDVIMRAYEAELERENVILSRPERSRLFRQVTRSVLEELLSRYDDVK